MFSFGGNFFVHKLFFDFIPFFNRFRNPGHITFIFTLTFGLICAFGIDRLFNDKKEFLKYFNKKYIYSFGGFVLLIVFSAFSGIINFFFPLAANEQISEWIKSQMIVFLFISVLYVAFGLLYINGKTKLNLAYIILIFCICLELYVFGFNQNNGNKDPNLMYNQDAKTIAMLKSDSPDNQFRVNMRDGGNMLFQRQQGLVDEIQLIEGVNVLTLEKKIPPSKPENNKQSLDLLNVKYKINVQGNQSGLTENIGYLPRAKLFTNYKVLQGDDEITNFMKSADYDYKKTIVLEKEPKLKIETADSLTESKGKVTVTEYGLNKIKIETETVVNSLLFLSEIFYPAWKAYINGTETEIFRANYCFRAIEIPNGKNVIEFVYNSDSTEKGKSFTYISLLFTLVLLISTIIVDIKKTKNES